MRQWTKTADSLPPEGVVVLTISPGGLECRMSRSGRLWFPEGGDIYVYWTPLFWTDAE